MSAPTELPPLPAPLPVYDDQARMVTFGERVRPYTESENELADERTSTRTLKGALSEELPVLRAAVTALQAVTDTPNGSITAAHTKTVAREARRIAASLIDVIRLVADDTR
jgi:hypothetical protein